MSIPDKPCGRCQVLPEDYPDIFDFYVSTPIHGSQERIAGILTAHDTPVEYVDGILKTTLTSAALPALTDSLRDQLTGAERRDSRALIVPEGTTPSLIELVHMQSLDAVVATVEGRQIVEILRAGRLITHVHRIVPINEPEKHFAYECLTRGVVADGSIIPPGLMFGTARRSGLLFYLDRESRVTAIRSGAPLVKHAKLFINFNPATIYAPEHCLRTTLETLEEMGLDKKDVVFEVVETDRIEDTAHLLGILNYYRQRGYQVALDDFGAGYNSLTILAELQPDYVKLDMGLVRNVDTDPYREVIVRNLLTLARELGIKTIAEGIERPEEHRWLADAGADYAQGYLFGKPGTVEAALANA